jgi:hypothetical protein
MKNILHPAATRGTADYGWLKANFSFSFGNFFDPNRTGFGKLRVLNDDLIAPAMGFSKHPHANMEIVTIPQTGALRHKDSMGFSEVIQSGEIQIMSAGSGIEHSEVNASTTEAISLFQIWVIPETENIAPRYAQEKIAPLLNENQLTTVIWPKDKAVNSQLYVHQQAYFNLGEFTEDTTTTYLLHQENQGAYIFVINGTVFVDNEQLNSRDAIGIWDTDSIELDIKKNSKVLLIEVPMN